MAPGDPAGKYTLAVSIQHAGGNGIDADVPVEIAVQFLEPGNTVGLVRGAGELATPTPTPTAKPKATATAAPASSSGGSGPGGWLVMLACVAGGLAVGLIASGVLLRRAAA
jgi:hypothetical protein